MLCYRTCRLRLRAGFVKSRDYFTYSPEPFQILDRKPLELTADDAVKLIKSNDTVFVHGGAATPVHLLSKLADHGLKSGLKDVTICHIHTEGPATYTQPQFQGIFRSNSFFIGKNCRDAVNEGRGDFVPVFLSDIPRLFQRKLIPIDVALVQVTPPDKHGFCSLGTSVDCARSAVINAKTIIAQVNPRLPRTFGDGIIHESHFDAIVKVDTPLPTLSPSKLGEAEVKIGQLIAENLVENGATLQMGIGNIPDAVLHYLTNHKDLGIHSEMFSDGIVELVEKGCITNHKKVIETGKILGSFSIGTLKLYDFMHNNPMIVMSESSYVNNPAIIAQNPLVTAINSCIEIDLTGQIASDSIGTRLYSGVGGQIDFLRGAAAARDGKGKPIIALLSVTKKNKSKIVPFLQQGSSVVTTRAHAHYIVTEYGIAHLFGKNLRQRAYALINIAHPDHREWLEKAAFERLKCIPSP